MTRIAVVGLGAMGRRIARRLLDAGHDLHVWNRTAAKAQELAAAGAAVAASPADAAAPADVVITMVADPAALAAVTEGPDGVAAGATAGTHVLEMSTVGPRAIERLRSALPREVNLLDAPVLGSLTEVENATLRVFAGGDRAAFDRVRPLMESLGTPIYAGPLGAGAAAKLVANSTLFGVLGVLGEAIQLADALGLDRGVAFDVLSATPVGAQADRRRASLESGDFPLRFALALAHKDADLVAAAAEEAGADLRVAAAARSWVVEAEAAGLGESDYSRVLELIARARLGRIA
ncbi:MAG TPA: NAD(P)-dependent oxidoreductase [Actinomycetota bacterium]|nr:NAD(P)-dependent oxidoreductase [Actinomycetota bacterium]